MSPEPDLLAAVAGLVESRLARHEGLFVLGISGSQGSGKSTLARALLGLLRDQAIAADTLSIDDLYLSRSERRRLAAAIHPLLATRGVPGTHDVGLGRQVLAAFDAGKPVCLPRFDKANDDPFDRTDWPMASGLRVLIFEGWCVGARPQPEALLAEPVNELEAEEDPAGIWRRYVNAQLSGPYKDIFSRIDAQVFLAAPGFGIVHDWRTQQERDIAGKGQAVMDEPAIGRFIQFYQRITQWMIEDMPGRADLVVKLDPQRRVVTMEGRP